MKPFQFVPHFNRSQRKGIIVLFVLILGLQFVLMKFDTLFVVKTQNYAIPELLQKKYDSLRLLAIEKNKPKIYPFNPNYLTDYKAYYLGMNLRETDRVLTFRKQGKYFNSKKQFQEVSGISDSLFAKLKPYIKIPKFKYANHTLYSGGSNRNFKIIDINLASAEDLMRVIGIGERLSARIVKYRNSMGGYTSKKQLNEVYGLKPEVIESLWKKFKLNVPEHQDRISKNYKKIEINSATADNLKKIKGIGERLSARIIKYRNKLGGFTLKEQLNDVYGLEPEVIRRLWKQFELKKPNKNIHKVSLNQSNIKELTKNPYIEYDLAKKIVSYRTLHGAFKSFEELLKIKNFPSERFKQIVLFLKL